MSNNEPPSRDQLQAAFLQHAQQRIDALIPEEFDDLREVAFDYALVMMTHMQLPDSPAKVRDNATNQRAAFLTPFREEGELALGMQVLDDLNATLAQYGNFKPPGGHQR